MTYRRPGNTFLIGLAIVLALAAVLTLGQRMGWW